MSDEADSEPRFYGSDRSGLSPAWTCRRLTAERRRRRFPAARCSYVDGGATTDRLSVTNVPSVSARLVICRAHQQRAQKTTGDDAAQLTIAAGNRQSARDPIRHSADTADDACRLLTHNVRRWPPDDDVKYCIDLRSDVNETKFLRPRPRLQITNNVAVAVLQ